jgi:hypothetical protein
MRQHVTPVVAKASSSPTRPEPLQRIDLASPENGGEAWLQDLVATAPGVLPIDEIEPAFAAPSTVCKELPVATGAVDLFLVNGHGMPVLVETKLWSNPEARRQVVAQALDYARCVAAADVESLEDAVRRSRGDRSSIYELVAAERSELPDRPAFYDAFAANLEKGRFLILLVGDGIRRDVEALTDFLRMHASMDFTFGLVELPAYKMPDGEDVLVTPRVVARTVDIERAATPAGGGGLTGEPSASETSTSRTRRTTVTEKTFLETLEQNEPGVAGSLRTFLDAAKERGIELVSGTSATGSLQLYWRPEEGQVINFGVLKANGRMVEGFHFFTGHDAMMEYKQQLADLIGGEVRETPRDSSVRGPDGGKPLLRDLLTKQDAWLAIIDQHIERGWAELRGSRHETSSQDV